MPPFGKNCENDSVSNIVTIDVGGQIFQTTKQTLAQSGSKSLFSQISNSNHNQTIPFIDRDPEIFSILLSLLRTGNLPSKSKSFDIQDLIFESRFYGIENLLINSQSNPSQLDAFNIEKSLLLPLSGREYPSAISTTDKGSLTVANGSKITWFDWSLKRKSTILTQFTAIDSLLALSEEVVAAGATDFSGLQIIDIGKDFVKQTLNWENVTRSGSTVQAIGASSDYLFTSFESSRRNSSCIMIYDLNDSLRTVRKVGHNEIFGADLGSGIPATKLQWVGSYGLLMASGSHSGPSGVAGNVRFWDIRSGKAVYEIKEKVDCFSDVTFSSTMSAMFKVGVNTGGVYFSDLRKMDADIPWVSLGDERKAVNGKKEGFGSRIEAHGNKVVCSKGGNLELWSEVVIGSKQKPETVFRRNLMGRAKDIGGNRITNLSFGGSKMFVTRKDQQCIEVWNSVKAF